ncbi:MAG TPA: prepilin peptidase [Tissierellaceae bacterium]|nr:prepilin peptidase [Tissierellaceae bacterium]
MIKIVFIYGLIIGSFLNVCIYRIPIQKNIAFPSSYCPKCNVHIRWYDNIPILSYLILLGQCRYCGDRISLQYPIIELLNAIIYSVLYYKFQFSLDFLFFSIISSILIIISFIDLKYMIIPDVLVSIIFISTIIHKILSHSMYNESINFLNGLAGFIISGVLFLAIVILSKGGMGGGDVTLISTLGFILGIKLILLNIFLSFLLGACISVILLSLKMKTKKDPIPFGPFIILSFFIVLLYGNNILSWYYNKFIL